MSLKNSTLVDTPRGNQPGLDLSSPVTVLPLVAALAIVVFTLVGGCIAYHRRQRQRTQKLARQLRVTERRIDAIGVITTKKQQALAARKADHCPPVAAPCSSISIANAQSIPPEKQQRRLNIPSSTTDTKEKKTVTVTVQLNDNTADLAINETRLDATDVSYYCSTCKLEESVSESVLQYRAAETDPINSSMAVECASIPAMSSISTLYSTNRNKQSHGVHNKVVRSKSDVHRKTLGYQLSKQSLRLMRGLGLASATSGSPVNKQIPAPRAVSIEIKPGEPKRLLGQHTLIGSCTGQQANINGPSENESSVVGGRYCNTSIMSKKGDSSAVQSVADSCTTDKREKWV